MRSDYWSSLQLLLAGLLVLLRFAFPARREPLAFAYLLLLAASALVPGAPAWLRIGALLCAAVGGLVHLRRRKQRFSAT